MPNRGGSVRNKSDSVLSSESLSQGQAAFASYLPHHGWTILENSQGFIRWKGKKCEGALRFTDSGEWQLLADPLGRWDRCANALVRLAVKRFSAAALDRLFARMTAGIAAFPLSPVRRVGCDMRHVRPES